MTTARTEVVEVAPEEPKRDVQDWMPFKGDDAFYCSLPAKTRDEKLQVFHMREGTHQKLKGSVNKEMNLAHIMAHTVMMEKEDGELVEACRCVLMDADGTTYQCVSEGVRSSLETLIKLFGRPGGEGWPIRLSIRLEPTQSGRSIMKLVPIMGVNGKGKK